MSESKVYVDTNLMNSILDEKLPRRDILKALLLQGIGSLVISFPLAKVTAQIAFRDPTAGPPPADEIDSWVAIHSDNTATVYLGFAELGQGALTALLQVAAEELDLEISQIKAIAPDTHLTPNQGGTFSSSAMRRGAPQVQRAAAEAREVLLRLAADYLYIPKETLQVNGGVITGKAEDNAFTTYGEIIGDRLFQESFTGTAPLKAPIDYKVVMKPIPRTDTYAKVSGKHCYIQHERLPGMLHARLVRPRGQGAYHTGVKVISVDTSSIEHLAATVIQKGSLLAVVAEREWDAVRGAAQLKVSWDRPDALPIDNQALFDSMRNASAKITKAQEKGDISTALNEAAHLIDFSGSGPYQAHAPFAPNCALASVTDKEILAICSTQDVYNTRTLLSRVLKVSPEIVRVKFSEGAGTYGHSCWDDAALAAALLSREIGRPIRLQYMRWDEHGWDYYGPAHLGQVSLGTDSDGKISAYEYVGRQHHWSLIETTEQSALNTEATEWPPFPAMQVNPLVLGGMYDIPNLQLINEHIDGRDFLRAGWLRSPLDLSFCFISEQAIDMAALANQQDPVAFRRQNISNSHWLKVLDAVTEAAKWQGSSSPEPLPEPTAAQTTSAEHQWKSGRGVGLGTHLASWGAAVADIAVNLLTGEVRILHLYGCIDCGRVINPANVENQIVGQLVQAASRMLCEEVSFNSEGVTSLDWGSYPVLRLKDSPKVTAVIINQPEAEPLGAGEEAMAATAAAIANAFAAATGKRMSHYPFTRRRVLSVLQDQA
jgi:nicotinate dehydrogenase subunit B